MFKTKKKILAVVIAVMLAVPALSVFSPQSAMAEITNDSKGDIVISDVQDNEDFIAVRVINTTYDNGTVSRAFADGFSYGDNSDARSDNGLSAYLALSDTAAIADAVEGFSKQISDSSETYRTVASNGVARFENLPMGQYVIIGTPLDASRVYQKMVGNVEPSVTDNDYAILPVEISAKYETIQVEKPKLEIEKTADVESIYRYAEVNYTVIVNPASDSSAVKNVHIVDALDDATIEQGMKLNQDVKITFANGDEVDNAAIVYTNVDGNTVGYTIDVPGEFSPDTVFIVTYSGNTEDLAESPRVVNVARTWCDDVEPIDDTVIIEGEEEDITPTQTPLEQFVQDLQNAASEFIVQTGDKLPFVIGGVAAVAIIAILLVRRRKDK